SASPWSVPRPSSPRPGRPLAPPQQRWMRPRRNWCRSSLSGTTFASKQPASSSWCALASMQARSELDTAEAQVQRAQAALEQARQARGPQGADNPQIREALAALEQARLDLSRTTLRAPGDGVVSNLQLNIGQFAAAGQPALTFLDARQVWL